MIRKILVFTFLIAIISSVNADGLKAYLSYAAFNTPDNNPYLETYLTVKGSSVNHMLVDEKYQGTVEVQIIFKQNDSIVNFAKYELAGPLVDDTVSGILNFLDVQRYSLGNGTFDIEVKLNDKNSVQEAIISFDQYSIDFPENMNSISDIEFLSSFALSDGDDNFSRNGYRLIPYVFNYFPENANTLSFYSELYNNELENGEGYLLTYFIRSFEVDKKIDNFSFAKRKTIGSVNPILGTIDINNLPSGNYLLVIEARNKNNEIISSREAFFQKYNPTLMYELDGVNVDLAETFVNDYNNHDTLAMYISWLNPLSSDAEKTFTISLLRPETDIDDMKKYFLNFWLERDIIYPEEAWLKYKSDVIKVNNSFSTPNTPGFYTDRGRVYLQYGAPDAMAKSYNEPSSFPYEIWHYYVLPNNQRDRKFVFYTQEIATNDFMLLHSDAVGEISNYKWRLWLDFRMNMGNLGNIDDEGIQGGDAWGSNKNDYYYQPR